MVREPRKVGQPRVRNRSLIATGTPSSGESGVFVIQRASAARACSRVVGSSIRQKALVFLSSVAMRARSTRATSTGEVSCTAKAFDSRGAFHCQSSVMLEMPFETRQRFLDHIALLAEGEAHIGVGAAGTRKEFAERNQRHARFPHQPFAEGAVFFIGEILDADGEKI